MDLDEAARLRKEKMSQLKRTMENEGFRDDLVITVKATYQYTVKLSCNEISGITDISVCYNRDDLYNKIVFWAKNELKFVLYSNYFVTTVTVITGLF
jgi:hypothetical protein